MGPDSLRKYVPLPPYSEMSSYFAITDFSHAKYFTHITYYETPERLSILILCVLDYFTRMKRALIGYIVCNLLLTIFEFKIFIISGRRN